MNNEEIYKKTIAEIMQLPLDGYSKVTIHYNYTEIRPEKDFIKRRVLGEYSDEVIDNYYN